MFDGYIEKNEQKIMDDNMRIAEIKNSNIGVITVVDKNTKNNIFKKESIWAKSMNFPKDLPLY